jgi:hypothetical protein
VVERVQIQPVPGAARWWAVSGTTYCLLVGLAVAVSTPAAQDLSWPVTAIFAAATLVPQPFRRRRTFRVACWASVMLIAVLGFFSLGIAGFLFLPPLLPQIVAAVVVRNAPVELPPRTAAIRGMLIGLLIIAIGSTALALFAG